MPLYGPYRITAGQPAVDPEVPIRPGYYTNLTVGRRQVSLPLYPGEPGVLRLPRPVLTELLLPTEARLWLKPREDGFELGPVLGLLVGNKTRSKRRLDEVKPVAQAGRGLVMAFCLADLEPTQRRVDGLLWTDKGWQPAALPWPGGVFKRANLPKEIHSRLDPVVGAPTFNYRVGAKWTVHQILNADSRIRPYLPETVKLGHIDQLLTRYPVLYLKPMGGSQGKGIYRLEKTDQGFRAIGRQNGKAIQLRFATRKALTPWLEQLNRKKPYLAQQGINLVSEEGRLIDFRSMAQRDGDGQWQCHLLCKIGTPGNHLSNVAQGGRIEPGPVVLTRLFGPTRAEELLAEIARVSAWVGDTLQAARGRIGDLGIDFGVTPEGQLWLLEVNGLPQHYAPYQRLFDPAILGRVNANPLAYASLLAGFPPRGARS